MKFSDLPLDEAFLRALADEQYEQATPIQAKSIPLVLDGKDVLGCAQTGTGKTAAFALPILQRLVHAPAPDKTVHRMPRVLVLAPTRELAIQIGEGFRAYGRHVRISSTVIFGGVGQNPQVAAIRRGVDVLIATPGRLLDLINQRFLDLKSIQTLVLDEADRMLDMGFIHDIRKISAMLPTKRQTLMFSATMPTEIRRLADALLNHPVEVSVAPVSSVAQNIDESVYFVEKANKPALLAALYDELAMSRTIVFTRTKHGADRVVKQLHRFGIRAEAIHGNKSQNARQRALENFKSGKTPIMVATDIASRGIDVDMITHVVNFDLTHEPETYVHRIGRTARAGQSGAAVSFVDHEERGNLRAIEKLTKRTLKVIRDLPPLPEAKPLAGHAATSHKDEDRDDDRPRRSQSNHAPRGEHGDQGSRGDRKPQGKPTATKHATGGGVRSHSASHSGGHGSRDGERSHAPRPQHAARPQSSGHGGSHSGGHGGTHGGGSHSTGHRNTAPSARGSHGGGQSARPSHTAGGRPSHGSHSARPSHGNARPAGRPLGGKHTSGRKR